MFYRGNIVAMEDAPSLTAFVAHHVLVRGALASVRQAALARLAEDPAARILVFDDQTGRQVDLDPGELPGQQVAPDGVAERPEEGAAPSRGRPKLGVVGREVTLLPRHWEWLEQQPNGASAALRRLIDEARRTQVDAQRARQARDAAHRFMTAMAGDQPGYEEALRALFAGDEARFQAQLSGWPGELAAYASRLAAPSF